MGIKYTKDGQVRTFDVVGDKVSTTLMVGNAWVTNPTLSMLEQDGWEVVVEPVVEPVEPMPYIPTIEELVERKIRERYSINQEFEVNRKRDTDSTAFEAYYQYVEECIAWAYTQEHREEEEV